MGDGSDCPDDPRPNDKRLWSKSKAQRCVCQLGAFRVRYRRAVVSSLTSNLDRASRLKDDPYQTMQPKPGSFSVKQNVIRDVIECNGLRSRFARTSRSKTTCSSAKKLADRRSAQTHAQDPGISSHMSDPKSLDFRQNVRVLLASKWPASDRVGQNLAQNVLGTDICSKNRNKIQKIAKITRDGVARSDSEATAGIEAVDVNERTLEGYAVS